jgi:hypothetical protein
MAALIFLVTRLVALAGGYMGVSQLIRTQPSYNRGWLAEMSLMWDAGFYYTIARWEYTYDPTFAGPTSIAFAPLYPFLMDYVAGALRFVTFGWDWGNAEFGSYLAAGLLISNVSFFVALALLIRFLRPRLGFTGASMAALGLAVLPTAFFFSALYTEGLFLVLVISAFSLAHSDLRWKWLCVGLIGMLATLSKFAGALLLPALLIDYLAQCGWKWRRVRADVLWLGLIPLGMAVYLGFLWWRFGSPSVLNDTMVRGWNHRLSFFPTTYGENLVMLWKSYTGGYPPGLDPILNNGRGSRLYHILDLGMPVALLVGAWLARKKLLASEWAWLVLGIIYPLSSNLTLSMARYMLPLWPGLIWLGTLKKGSRWLGVLLMLVSVALMAWCASIYGRASWIG